MGKKNGPLGPTRAAGRVWTGSRRYLLEVSILVRAPRTARSHDELRPPRRDEPTIAEEFGQSRASAGVLGPVVRRASRSAASRPSRGRPRTSHRGARARAWRPAAPRPSTPSSAASQRLLPGLALGLDLAPRPAASAARRPRACRSPSAPARRARTPARWSSICVTVAGREPGRARELAGRQLAALVELDQQLELGVAQLRAAEVRVAPAQAVEAAEHAAEGLRRARSARGGARSLTGFGLRPARLSPVALIALAR